MGIEHRTYNFDATAVAGGAVTAFVALSATRGFVDSAIGQAATDTVGARVGGKITRVPRMAGALAGAWVARNQGLGDASAALASRYAGEAAERLPLAQRLVEEVAETASSGAVRTGAGLTAAGLREAPSAVGAIVGAKLAGWGAGKLLPAVAFAGAAAVGGVVTTWIAPSYDVSFSTGGDRPEAG